MVDELLQRMEKVARELRKGLLDFPVRYCYSAASALHSEEGFLIVDGKYLGEVNREPWTGWIRRRSISEGPIDHYIAFDPVSRHYIDITAFQFDSGLPEILIMDENDSRIAVDGKRINEAHIYIPRRMEVLAEDKITLLPAPRELLPEYMVDETLSRAVIRQHDYSLNL